MIPVELKQECIKDMENTNFNSQIIMEMPMVTVGLQVMKMRKEIFVEMKMIKMWEMVLSSLLDLHRSFIS
jgi:hypothetical protein